jgi:hypothetical protein
VFFSVEIVIPNNRRGRPVRYECGNDQTESMETFRLPVSNTQVHHDRGSKWNLGTKAVIGRT